MKHGLLLMILLNLYSSLSAQVPDSLYLAESRIPFTPKQLYIPGTLMLAGVLTDTENRKGQLLKTETENKHLMGLTGQADDFLIAVPVLALYGLEMTGMQARTDIKNRTVLMVKGQALSTGMVLILKSAMKKTRPDGTAFSFPSGHSAIAFAGATQLSMEYGQHHRWVPFAAYGLAATVGAMRLGNDKHYLSDVLFGAGLGILSMKMAYWTHRYRWNRPESDADPLLNLYQQSIKTQ